MSLMMMKTNPITPPRELVREWYGSEDCPDGANALANYLCTQAAQWGADQELEACCDQWITSGASLGWHKNAQGRGSELARRPKPPSLKEQALKALTAIEGDFNTVGDRADTIRRALEALDD
jgi:hypothetical protein